MPKRYNPNQTPRSQRAPWTTPTGYRPHDDSLSYSSTDHELVDRLVEHLRPGRNCVHELTFAPCPGMTLAQRATLEEHLRERFELWANSWLRNDVLELARRLDERDAKAKARRVRR